MRVIPIIGKEPPARNQTRPDTPGNKSKKKNQKVIHSRSTLINPQSLIARS